MVRRAALIPDDSTQGGAYSSGSFVIQMFPVNSPIPKTSSSRPTEMGPQPLGQFNLERAW